MGYSPLPPLPFSQTATNDDEAERRGGGGGKMGVAAEMREGSSPSIHPSLHPPLAKSTNVVWGRKRVEAGRAATNGSRSSSSWLMRMRRRSRIDLRGKGSQVGRRQQGKKGKQSP
jgi:hypothetical protein